MYSARLSSFACAPCSWPPFQPERLDTLLYSLVNEAKSNSSVNAELRRAGVVTWRGIMTKICTLPYAGRDELSLNAQMVRHAYVRDLHSLC